MEKHVLPHLTSTYKTKNAATPAQSQRFNKLAIPYHSGQRLERKVLTLYNNAARSNTDRKTTDFSSIIPSNGLCSSSFPGTSKARSRSSLGANWKTNKRPSQGAFQDWPTKVRLPYTSQSTELFPGAYDKRSRCYSTPPHHLTLHLHSLLLSENKAPLP